MVIKLHGLHLYCDGAAQSEPGVSCSSGTGFYETQWDADGCGTELVLIVGQLQERKKQFEKGIDDRTYQAERGLLYFRF